VPDPSDRALLFLGAEGPRVGRPLGRDNRGGRFSFPSPFGRGTSDPKGFEITVRPGHPVPGMLNRTVEESLGLDAKQVQGRLERSRAAATAAGAQEN